MIISANHVRSNFVIFRGLSALRADCNFCCRREMPDAPLTLLFSPFLLISARAVRLFRPLAAPLFVLSVNLSLWQVLQQIIYLLTTILGSLYTFYITSIPSLMQNL